MPELLIITGPTAVGKTAVAVQLAREMETEVISADSMQVYRHLSLGTAKPTSEELQGVAYHLVDCVEPDYQYNLGDFLADADALIARLCAQGKLPVVCGGTGLYLRGLLQGVFGGTTRDTEIRKCLASRAEQEGLAGLYEELKRVDPAATHIMPNDRQRILRALEVYYVTGRPITQLQTQSSAPERYQSRTFILTMPREELYRRIDRRVDEMLARGLVEEVREYLASGFSRDNPAIKALGYSEWIAYLAGELSYEEARTQMQTKTRRYAKRQLTWFRSMHGAQVLEVQGKTPAQICMEIKKSLANGRVQP